MASLQKELNDSFVFLETLNKRDGTIGDIFEQPGVKLAAVNVGDDNVDVDVPIIETAENSVTEPTKVIGPIREWDKLPGTGIIKSDPSVRDDWMGWKDDIGDAPDLVTGPQYNVPGDDDYADYNFHQSTDDLFGGGNERDLAITRLEDNVEELKAKIDNLESELGFLTDYVENMDKKLYNAILRIHKDIMGED